jgi:hypothetical protein
MAIMRNLPLIAAAVSAAALIAASPASARTICRADGICFNTSGEPIAPWQQPAFRGGFAYPPGYGYYGYYRYPYHHRHHWHYEYGY